MKICKERIFYFQEIDLTRNIFQIIIYDFSHLFFSPKAILLFIYKIFTNTDSLLWWKESLFFYHNIMYETYFYILVGIFIIFFIIDTIIAYLNTLSWSDEIPQKVSEIYDIEKYKKQQAYDKQKYVFWKYSSLFSFIITLWVLIWGWFWWLDELLRSSLSNEIILSLAFFWVILLIQTLIWIPFSYYQNFVIEEKFGFNKMTKKIFFTDLIKSLVISMLIGWILLSLIVWVYTKLWENFWIITWVILSIFSVFMMMFYSTFIVPIFNKQTPLEDGELKEAIFTFAKKVGFEMDNIFVIDGSKRSSKANAYFSGFWSKKRIVLYDTLIKDLTIEELVAVLAHEIGHYQKKHTLQMLVFSLVQTGVILYLFSLLIDSQEFALALGANQSSFHIWAIAFGILFTPISFVLGIFGNIFSRKNEFEADEYAKVNYDGKYLLEWLKKLSKNNLSNLTPHPVYEFVHYTHPSVLKRIARLEK